MSTESSPRGIDLAFELADWVMIGLDSQGSVRLFNKAAERTTGFAREAVMGRPFVDLLDACKMQSTKFEDFISGQPADESAFVCSVESRRGGRRSVAWKLARSPEGAGALVEIFAFGSDTEAEKTATLVSMCAQLAHQIRNPLNGALLHITILERALDARSVNGDCAHALSVIKSELRRLSSDLTEILELNMKVGD